ncbi:hypothetical protein [Halorussus halobius]|uniref:hypothetical protein n=1 Tax=Halorussus halobius TaxID=1710537 RepID=UPI001092CA55|nr:hypothetical protein [Halorussus halobius]
MKIEWELVAFAVLLVGLAANPVWLYPDDADSTAEYRAVEVTDENRYEFVMNHPDVLECNGVVHERTCGFEAAARDGGVTVDADATQYATSREYQFVAFPLETYRTAMAEDDGGVRLTLERVTMRQIVADLAYPYARASDPAKTVVDEGTAVVDHGVPDRDLFVGRGDRYYYLDYLGTPGPPLHGWLSEVRWLMWLGTVPLSVGAAWRWSTA